jgi:hypothetical protein
MDDAPRAPSRSRDDASHSYDMTSAVYGMFPSRAPDTDSSIRRSRAGSPAKSASKRKDVDASPLSIKLARSMASPSWLPRSKRTHLQNQQMELHQSTCLNLNSANADSTESDLWILPDFDDWELENENAQQTTTKDDGEWAPRLRRAASSNRERLRARLEGDGWDFVGGKYGEDEKAIQEALSQGEESVDEEFDVVVLAVLPVVSVSC